MEESALSSDRRTEHPELSFEHISHDFYLGNERIRALDDVTFDVQSGEILVLFGPSGCGKSTLLNMAAGLIRPTQGKVTYRGMPVTGVPADVGYLTQHDSLLPWRTVERNVAVGLEIQGVTRKARKPRVQKALELVGLQGFERHYIRQLSGGMRKRAALARTLICEPERLLMDEPYGALDAQLRLNLQQQLLNLCERKTLTIVFVTHDLTEAVALADRIIVLSARPGRIHQVISVDIPRPRRLTHIHAHPEYLRIYKQLWDDFTPADEAGDADDQ